MNRFRGRSTTTDLQDKRLGKGPAIGGSLLLAALFALTTGMFGGAATAAEILQCDAIGDGGGQGIVCTVEISNTLDNTDPAAPVTSSTVTMTSCLGGANAAEAGLCTTTGPITSTELVTHVDQCNYAVNGGGASLECEVSVINTIIGDAPVTAVPATVNQCNGSLDTGDVDLCAPEPATTDPSTATVIQCNDSVNGGGSVLNCAVDPTSTVSDAIPVTINQCNNSANGGGSTVICRVKMTTTIIKVTPPDDDTPPGDDDNPPGDDDTPPGDDDTPPGDDDTPPGEEVVPAVIPGVTPGGTSGTPETPSEAAERLAAIDRLAQTGPATDPSLFIGGAIALLLLGEQQSSSPSAGVRVLRARDTPAWIARTPQ